MNLNKTDPIELTKYQTSFSVGLDCPADKETKIKAVDLSICNSNKESK